MKFPPAYTGTGAPPPPSSSYAERSASFPAISQSAISTPLIACATSQVVPCRRRSHAHAREDDVGLARIAANDETRERLGDDRVGDVRVFAAPAVADLSVAR